MNRTYRGHFATPVGRRWLFGLLYVSEGAPMGFIWWALPAILTARGQDLPSVTSLASVLTLPWVCKFLIGPLVDLGCRHGHSLRSWITVCQLCMGFILLPLAFLDWIAHYPLLVGVLLLHACFAATQDVAIDTLAIRTVPIDELGKINGWMQTGMLSGRACVAAGAVTLAAAGYESLLIFLLVALIWIPLLVLQIARPDEAPLQAPPTDRLFSMRVLLGGPMLPGIWIALTAGAGFEFFTVTAGPLLQNLGGSVRHTTVLFGAVAPVGLALGALAGGYIAALLGPRTATAAGIFLVGCAVGGFTLLQFAGIVVQPYTWLGVLAIIYIASGLLICASYTLLMHMARGEFAATRFSLFMSVTNGCEAWSAFVGGRLAGSLGYSPAMLILVAASALALPVLFLARLYTGKENVSTRVRQ